MLCRWCGIYCKVDTSTSLRHWVQGIFCYYTSMSEGGSTNNFNAGLSCSPHMQYATRDHINIHSGSNTATVTFATTKGSTQVGIVNVLQQEQMGKLSPHFMQNQNQNYFLGFIINHLMITWYLMKKVQWLNKLHNSMELYLTSSTYFNLKTDFYSLRENAQRLRLKLISLLVKYCISIAWHCFLHLVCCASKKTLDCVKNKNTI